MKNAYAISGLARQLGKVSEQIDMLATGAHDTEQTATEISSVYENMLLDEVEHAQILTLQLTGLLELAIGEEPSTNADEGEGSSFAAGDLTAVRGKDSGNEKGGGEADK